MICCIYPREGFSISSKKTVKNVPCVFCGCLCDDIALEVENNRIVKNINGCSLSKSKFLNHLEDRLLGPAVRINGILVEVSLEKAVAHAAEALTSARRPLIYGLSSTENDTHQEAYYLAELLGGVVDNTSSVCHGTSMIGSQESGDPLGSLAEVRHRADLVVYWGSNPQFAHPRHISRYIRQPGEYMQNPKKDRKIWVFDVRSTATSRIADEFFQIEPGTDLEVISVIRALVRGHEMDIDRVGGLAIEDLAKISEAMKSVRYGVFFYGLGLTQSKGQHRNVDAAIRLIQDLNSFTKWVMIPMRGHFNVAGANETSTWQTGYPFAVDYSRGYPRYQPGEYSAVDLIRRRETDVLLNVAADPVAHFPRDALEHLKRIPIINLDPKRNVTSLIAEVNIPTAIAGIECDGAAVRMDGLPLYLRKIVEPPEGIIPDRDVLKLIIARLRMVTKR
ncbi:MAG: formylmethanofuran dehydrogenase subunit B [Candidatus Thorarchaeota archaeon]|nr:formylmethanofuran dehydrogenase subunit B [Candidatus Thorarchaeota archaeon]